MRQELYIAIGIGVAVAILLATLSLLSSNSKLPYRYRPILTKNEYPFWRVLYAKMAECGVIVCPKVRMEDFLSITSKQNKRRLTYRGRIKSRHIDFILCDKNMNMLAGLELDDSSHKYSASQIEGDKFKNSVFKAIDKPLYRVSVSKNYEEVIDDLISKMKGSGLIRGECKPKGSECNEFKEIH